ncbi:MAG: aldehyde dehydrogenase family protein, partial [Thermoanaerobaculia bacterium]|nr:aldehyde dehydrogenase family protein [Thermoanaerobaculia bacterium]
MEEQRRLFIGGEWSAPGSGRVIEVVSPHTEKPIAAVACAGPEDVDRAVAAARSAFDAGPWPRLDPSERVAAIRRLAELYNPRRREMAKLITSEMGSPISFSKFSQATLPMMLLGAFADMAEAFPWEERRPGFFGGEVLVRRESAGVVAAIV